MQTVSHKYVSALKLTVVLVVAILASGCISAKSKPTEVATVAEPAPAPKAVEKAVVEPEVEPNDEISAWTVVTGDSLWAISGVEDVYNVHEQWPLIYKANLDQIVDADLIYPGQVLTIPRDSMQNEIDAAIQHAKTRGAWEIGAVEKSDKAYLRNSK